MNDEWPLVASKEYGEDEDATVALLKNFEAARVKLDQFKPKIGELEADCQKMLAQRHYESVAIKAKQVRNKFGTSERSLMRIFLQALLESRCRELEGLASKRQLRLNETLQLHRFNRECDEVSKWMKEKETVASAEDTGRDLEHVEVC